MKRKSSKQATKFLGLIMFSPEYDSANILGQLSGLPWLYYRRRRRRRFRI